MAYREATDAIVYSRAKYRALSALQAAHPEEYDRLLEEAMRDEGFIRVPRGPHDRGGKGPMVWSRTTQLSLFPASGVVHRGERNVKLRDESTL